MATQTHAHTHARRQAVQVLYQHELTGCSLEKLADVDFAKSASSAMFFTVPIYPEGVNDNDLVATPLSDYAKCLIRGVAAHEKQIDEDIIKTAENWALERMPIVDRNIIRVAVYEIAYEESIPTGVAINEAVEVAKLYCSSDSPKFVNGILGRIATLYDETAVDPEKNNSEDKNCANNG